MRESERFEKPGDVVTVKYGLVTYAAFFTDDPAMLAKVLLQEPVSSLSCYPIANAVVVQTIDGKARIEKKANKYRYTPEYGDPLELNAIIAQLTQDGEVDTEGFIEDRPLFEATDEHVYPDVMRRVWQAFHGLVKQPPDLVVCLKDGWCHGRELFHAMIGGATSTHGSLNRLNSTTFVLTMWGELPRTMRLEEFRPQLKKLQQEKLH